MQSILRGSRQAGVPDLLSVGPVNALHAFEFLMYLSGHSLKLTALQLRCMSATKLSKVTNTKCAGV